MQRSKGTMISLSFLNDRRMYTVRNALIRKAHLIKHRGLKSERGIVPEAAGSTEGRVLAGGTNPWRRKRRLVE